MSDEVTNIITVGVLGVIALLLLLVIARLARLERALNPWRSESDTESTATNETKTEAVAAAPTEEPPETVSETPEASPLEEASPQEEEPAEGPFEKDGRWWYRRESELLVFDERTETWVDADAPEDTGVAFDAPAEATPVQVKPHPLEEARGWDTAPITPAASSAPIVEPVEPPAEPVVVAPVEEQPAPTESSSPAAHWKCPSCGVINGSTATSCRMCFAARP